MHFGAGLVRIITCTSELEEKARQYFVLFLYLCL